MTLSTDELTDMRSVLTASLPDACTISRYSQASDSQGGWTDTYATASTTVCRIAPAGGLSPQEKAIAEKLGTAGVWMVTLPALTDVTNKDRIVIGSRSLEVAALLAPHSWEIGRRVLCKEIT